MFRSPFHRTGSLRSRTTTVRPRLEVLEDRCVPASVPAGFVESSVIGGFNVPTAMHLASDGRIFVTEQGGNLRVIENGVLQSTPFVSLTVDAAGERGLLGVTTDANFESNQYVYVYYTVPANGDTPAFNRVSRFTASGNVAAGGETILFTLDNLSAATNHNGGAIQFGPDGKLYIATGDAGNPANSQSLANTHGKILRINADGTIPNDNPFFNETVGNDRAIYAAGLRNPFNFAFDPASGVFYINDVGASTFEEINQGFAGANYGWPHFEGPGGSPTFVEPLHFYGRGGGNKTGFAIVGAAFYSPDEMQFPASAYAGDYFFADFISGWVRHYDSATGSTSLFATGFSRPVALLVTDTGSLLVLSRGTGPGQGTVTQIDYVENLSADQLFVQSLFNDFLGRSGTPAQVNNWVNLLPTLGRQGVANAIARSNEALGRIVDAAYMSILGRKSDPNGRAGWINFLSAGNSVESMLALFLGGAEFANRANNLIGGSSSNANYVRALYRVVLNRDPNSNEVAGWVGMLNSGSSRQAVALQFVQSGEFRAGAVRTFYGDPTQTPSPYQPYFRNVLRRLSPPDQPTINGWVNNGIDLLSISIILAGSPESFANRTAG